jgi:hypothetical protein
MNTTSICRKLLTILPLTCALGAFPTWGEDNNVAAAPSAPTNPSQEERAYQEAIAEIESSEGAYAEGLSESLYSLALSLQSQGRHAEAIKLFRRGVHLTRINEGLYCAQQIPLLQGEIASHIAAQNYAVADERQHYLYRVQMRSLGSGDALTDALTQQAKWQYSAYQLDQGPAAYTHLMTMRDLYQQAMQDVIAREGEKSPKLLPPLNGMLQAQYLISGYEWRESDQVFREEQRLNEPLLRFKAYSAESYEQGSAILEAIAGIEQQHGAQDGTALARNLVMLGDWHLWNGRTKAAWQAYREAETELTRAGDAQTQIQRLFGEPVALPDIAELSPLPPTVAVEQADVLLAFGVSEDGRVRDLERMDENEADDRQASRLMRQLRRTTFRPRFEAGQPVETEKLVKAFNIQ